MSNHTEEELNVTYKLIAEPYLYRKYGLYELDQKFGEYKPSYIPAEWRVEMKNELELQYISLLNQAHTERLKESEKEVLSGIINSTVSDEEIVSFIEETYRKVLAGSLEKDVQVQYFPDIYDRGMFPGDAIVFVFSDTPEYGTDGSRDENKEGEKTRVFNSVKKQFEELINANESEKVYLVRY